MALVIRAVLGVSVSRVALVAIAMVRVREVLSAKLLVAITMALVAVVRSVVTVMRLMRYVVRYLVTMVRSMGSVVAIGRAMVTVAVAMDAVARMGNRVGIDFFVIGLLDTSDVMRIVMSMAMVAVRAMVAAMTVTVVINVVAPLIMGVSIRQVVLNFSCRGNGSEASKGEGFEHFEISFNSQFQLVFIRSILAVYNGECSVYSAVMMRAIILPLNLS